MSRPRILCLADVLPWPARDGYRIRLSHVVRALAEAGSLDFFAAERGRPDLSAMPNDIPFARVKATTAPSLPITPSLLGRTMAGPLPRRVLWRDWGPGRAELRAWADSSYDLVWYSHADALAGLGLIPARASVFDTDNLEDMRLRSLRAAHLRGLVAALGRPRGSTDLRREVRYRATGALATFDAGRWRRLQHRLSEQVDTTVVCSELDQRRLGVANAVVIPNGYAAPEVGCNGSRPGHVMSMVGLFHYGPNSDGARYFVHEVLPRIRGRVPDATVRFIGRHDGHLGDLGRHEGVELTGEVDDVAQALAGTRVSIVPIRAGSGTRLKVLEAFACRIPVVSTTLGCEGLGAVPGRDLLVADTSEAFADACARLLTDDRLHQRVTGDAWSLFESRYRWEDIRLMIGGLVASLTTPTTAPARDA